MDPVAWIMLAQVLLSTACIMWLARRSFKRLEDSWKDEDMNHSMTSDFRRDGSRPGPIPTPAIPDVQDSGVWSVTHQPAPAPRELPALRYALEVVLEEGERRALCGACESPSTMISPVQWEKRGPLAHQTFVIVLETCSNCEAQQQYRLDAPAWVALAAFRAWDQFEQATETLDVSLATQAEMDKSTDPDQVNRDLKDLDE